MPKNKKIIIKPDGNIYWGVQTYSVIFLIPKKRGVGFLRQPVGHHVNDLSRFIAKLGYDCFGLDGYLDVPIWFNRGQDFTDLAKAVGEFYNKKTIEVNAGQILDYLLGHK